MPEVVEAIRRYVAELRRRRVFRTAGAYLIAGWLAVQVAGATFDPLGLPHWALRALIITVAAGFLPVCVLAWIFDITTRGIERTASATATQPASAATAPSSAIASIAILPFADLSPAHDQDWFCDGLAEEIIDSLCCVRGLRVASRTASFRFRDGSVDPREIGRLLGVDAILEGSVRKSGERLKITAQLIDAHDGYHLWSESYERSMEDVFAIQGEIAKNVAQSLKMSLSGKDAGRFQRYAPANMMAYEFYLRGRQLAGRMSDQHSWLQAPSMFRRAVELDPDYAQAHAGLADSLAQQILWRLKPAMEVLPEAAAAAAKALDLAPDLAEAHVAQGHIRSLAGDREGAIRSFERAIELNPGLVEAYYYFARHCYAQGDYARAADLYLKAWHLQPDESVVLVLAVNALDAIGDRAAGDALAKQALAGLLHQGALEPDNARVLYMTAGIHARLGQPGSGKPYADKAFALRPDDFTTLYNLACFHTLSGDGERALDMLERAIRTGGGYADWIEHDSDLAPLRGHPRFEALLAGLR
ncbi:MAG TPA: tetratricopeptide repeat protein [Xanthomonadaceae bacterium]|jgi:adenylate cyclase